MLKATTSAGSSINIISKVVGLLHIVPSFMKTVCNIFVTARSIWNAKVQMKCAGTPRTWSAKKETKLV
jgi:hypothetical protein